jgi:hypothetical protein
MMAEIVNPTSRLFTIDFYALMERGADYPARLMAGQLSPTAMDHLIAQNDPTPLLDIAVEGLGCGRLELRGDYNFGNGRHLLLGLANEDLVYSFRLQLSAKYPASGIMRKGPAYLHNQAVEPTATQVYQF